MEFDFGKVDSLEKVPEQFRGIYEEQEGGAVVAQNFSGVVTAIQGLNKALKAARAEAKAKSVDLSPLQEYGASPEEIKASVQNQIQDLQDQLAQDGEAKLNLNKIREELAAAHSRDLEAHKNRNGALQNQLYSLLVENEATQATIGAKGIPELLMPFIKNQVKVIEEDGQYRVFVVDSQGDRRYSGITGQPMTIKELVLELKANEKFGRLFESEAPSGGGMPPGAGVGRQTRQGAPKTSHDKIATGVTNLLRKRMV